MGYTLLREGLNTEEEPPLTPLGQPGKKEVCGLLVFEIIRHFSEVLILIRPGTKIHFPRAVFRDVIFQLTPIG
jgi:hypothetical protein